MGAWQIPEADMRKFMDALKESIRQRHVKIRFLNYMRDNLGAKDYKKWRRLVEGNSGPLGEIVEAHITDKGEVIISEGELKKLFKRHQSKGADVSFLNEFVEFLKKNPQDALELKNNL